MTAPEWNNTSEGISVSLPSSLIEIVDYHRGKSDHTRASYIMRAVKKYIASERAEDMSFWREEYQRIYKESC